jgi:phospholipase C
MSTSRRDFLKFAALLSGATGIAGFVPESIQRAFAIEPAPGSSYADAEHIVILMQENRSFDHTLGTLQGVRGFSDPRAIRQPNGSSVFVQTSQTTGTSYVPWRLDLADTRITWMGSVPHTRNSQVDAWNEGRYDNWLDAKKSYNKDYQHIPITMGHYTRADLPFYYAMADAFTVCDQSYCGAMSSTTPNRSMFWTGTLRDRKSTDSRVYMRNDEFFRDSLTWKTFPERLSESGIPWRFYQNELTTTSGLTTEEDAWLSNYGCNILEQFAAYNVQTVRGAADLFRKDLEQAQQKVTLLEEELSELSDATQSDELQARLELARSHVQTLTRKLAGSGPAGYDKLTSAQKALHNAAFVTNRNDPAFRSLTPLEYTADGRQERINVPKGDVLHQFRADVESGSLPAISWLAGPQHFSDHPSSPWYGAWWVSEIMDILTKNPEVWRKTIFILTYDENDGYFDHSPSFVAPDPKRPETGAASAGLEAELEYSYKADELAQGIPAKEARSGPIGLGFRVPTIVASPWTRGGWVNSQIFDHTSTLQFLEHFVSLKYGKTVHEENMSQWRRAVSGDFTSCFRSGSVPEPAIHYVNRDRHIESIAAARNKQLPTGYAEVTAAEAASITASPRTSARMPRQEPGTRPACALPYELQAHGTVSPDGQAFQLELTAATDVFGARSAGAPFNVYLRNLSADHAMQAATYTVKAGDTLRPSFPLAQFQECRFEVEVLGPNGFYRRFTGTAEDAPVIVTAAAEQRNRRTTGALQLTLHNASNTARTITIADNSYGTKTLTRHLHPQQMESVSLALQASSQWYDFTIEASGSKAKAHFAGRLETDSPSRTDPAMGA